MAGLWIIIVWAGARDVDTNLFCRTTGDRGARHVGLTIPGGVVSVHSLAVNAGATSLRIMEFCPTNNPNKKRLGIIAFQPGLVGAFVHRVWGRLVHELSGLMAKKLSRAGKDVQSLLAPRARATSLPSPSCAPINWEKVSIIIPSRDRPDLLEAGWHAGIGELCQKGCEIIIVDHASCMPATAVALRALEKHGVKVVRADGPFNFSRLINLGVQAARREMLLLLNDDVTPANTDTFTAIMRASFQSSESVVGAVLLYPSGAIQHAGMALGMGGVVGHVGRGLDVSDPRMRAWLQEERPVSAVTGAVLAVSQYVFQSVSGFDERLHVECGDVDFCLRARALTGKDCVLASGSTWIHPELSSRGDPATGPFYQRIQRDRGRFLQRWNQTLAFDPFYPHQLSRLSEAPILTWPSLTGKLSK
jgi:GT2 family glycosyltransferase